MSLSKKKLVKSRWPEEEVKLFGKDGSAGLDVARIVRKDLLSKPAKLSFTPNSELEELIRRKPNNCADAIKHVNSVFWREVLYRAYFAASTSLLRNLSWISGATSSISSAQFLPFVASLRSLTESCVDSWYSLGRVEPTLLGEKHFMINSALKGEADTLSISSEMEDCLIHYSHGRKLKKSEKKEFPDSHIALQPYQYFEHYQSSGGKLPLKELYDLLSQFAHPSMLSSHIYSDVTSDDRANTYTQPIDSDRKLIKSIISDHKDELREVLKLAISPSILTFKALNAFDMPELKTAIVNEINV